MPILGVCLGHQTIGQAFGGKIIHAKTIMHGKTSEIHHTNEGVFKDIKSPLKAPSSPTKPRHSRMCGFGGFGPFRTVRKGSIPQNCGRYGTEPQQITREYEPHPKDACAEVV